MMLCRFSRATTWRGLREVRNRMEAATNVWNQWVLGYTPQRQRESLRRVRLQEPGLAGDDGNAGGIMRCRLVGAHRMDSLPTEKR